MTLPLALAHAAKVAVLVLLAGMVMRGKVRQCWSFVVYLGFVLVYNTLGSFWPDLLTPSFLLMKQGTYDVMKMAIALELAWRVFAAFPGAWQRARAVLATVLALSTALILAAQPQASYNNFFDWQPKITTGAIWLLTATALVVVRYEIPIRDWQRAIMLGYAPYLLVFVTLLRVLKARGWGYVVEFGNLDNFAYLGLLLFWTYAAWRAEPVIELPQAAGRGDAHERDADGPAEQPVEEAVDALA